ncbi:MAG TPA: GNAT family N-acetyltransferase [Acidobacteriaceae bacterium]|jgi:ribosomal protein S18 acetylase RimI-like enzyme|nr:GNAT family N-acetyltransferase [Acidobacteriaceae bacterium]
MADMAHLRRAQFGGGEDDAQLCRTLMREYAAYLNASVGGEHICVESLEAELAGLPGAYAEPAGAVLLAFGEGLQGSAAAAGCVALKPLLLEDPARAAERACEMKRLWVRPGQQGQQIGRRLAEAVVAAARERGYTAMYLDTMPATMPAAYALYRAMGFAPVARYNENPVLRQAESLEIAFLRMEL